MEYGKARYFTLITKVWQTDFLWCLTAVLHNMRWEWKLIMNYELYFEVDWRDICLKVRKKHTKNLCQAALDTKQIPPKYKCSL